MFPKREPQKGERLCPFDNVLYSQVPGYVSGCGCPVCKAIGQYHLPVANPPTRKPKQKKPKCKTMERKVQLRSTPKPSAVLGCGMKSTMGKLFNLSLSVERELWRRGWDKISDGWFNVHSGLLVTMEAALQIEINKENARATQ